MRENLKTCDEVFLDITNRTDTKINIEAYNQTEKTVALVYQTVGLIGNMGLAGFLSDEYDGDSGYVETIRAFESIGDLNMARTLAEAIDIHRLQSSSTPESDENKKLSESMDKLDDKFIENEDSTIDLLANFIKTKYRVPS
jgi:hypothetical protein